MTEQDLAWPPSLHWLLLGHSSQYLQLDNLMFHLIDFKSGPQNNRKLKMSLKGLTHKLDNSLTHPRSKQSWNPSLFKEERTRHPLTKLWWPSLSSVDFEPHPVVMGSQQKIFILWKDTLNNILNQTKKLKGVRDKKIKRASAAHSESQNIYFCVSDFFQGGRELLFHCPSCKNSNVWPVSGW